MTRPQDIEHGRLKLRPGKAADVALLIEKYGADHFHEGGFDAFSTVDIERAAREMTRLVERDDTPLVIAEIDGEPIGWISWTMMHVFTRAPIAVLWTIYVAPAYRNSAVGRQLVWGAVEIARREGACAFFATVAPTSAGAQALCHLFRSFGFEPMGGAFSKAL
jgi:L-amino acid N-acyltransferase YncA